MNLQTIMPSKISQTQKDKYRIILLICHIQKNGTDELICKAEIETQTQRKDLWIPGGEEGVG